MTNIYRALGAAQLKVASDRIYIAIECAGRLAATGDDALDSDRAELQHIAEQLDAIVARWAAEE